MIYILHVQYSSIQTWHLNTHCHNRVIQQIYQAASELHVSAWYNIVIWSSINTSDALVKCSTRKLRIVRMLHVNCMCGHLWIVLPLILHDVHSIQPSSSIVRYFRSICLLNKLVTHAQMSFFYFGTVVKKLDNTRCKWCCIWMVRTPIIHTLAMSVYCVHHTLYIMEY